MAIAEGGSAQSCDLIRFSLMTIEIAFLNRFAKNWILHKCLNVANRNTCYNSEIQFTKSVAVCDYTVGKGWDCLDPCISRLK